MFNYNNQYGQQMPRYNTQGVYGQMQQPSLQQPIQPMPSYTPQPVTPIIQGLQGKSVDSIDVVKAMDIPLDGTISYFPLTDGSAIVTKQLQSDGSSKTIIYKPIESNEKEEVPKYITNEQLEEAIKKIDNKDLKEEIKVIKRQIKDITNDIRDLGDDIKERKE